MGGSVQLDLSPYIHRILDRVGLAIAKINKSHAATLHLTLHGIHTREILGLVA